LRTFSANHLCGSQGVLLTEAEITFFCGWHCPTKRLPYCKGCGRHTVPNFPIRGWILTKWLQGQRLIIVEKACVDIMHAELPKEDIRLSSSQLAWAPTVPSMVQRTFDVDNPYHLLLAILQGINNSSRAETIQKFGDRLLSCYSHKRECIGFSVRDPRTQRSASFRISRRAR
jgi:hypothetical protein